MAKVVSSLLSDFQPIGCNLSNAVNCFQGPLRRRMRTLQDRRPGEGSVRHGMPLQVSQSV